MPNGNVPDNKTLLWLVGIMVTVTLAGIPWAFSLHGRLTSIETKLGNLEIPPKWIVADVTDLQIDMVEIERRVRALEHTPVPRRPPQ